MTQPTATHRQRVALAIAHQTPDRIPRDFACEPEVWVKLEDHFDTRDHYEILRLLDVDCRVVSYDAEAFCNRRCGTFTQTMPGGLTQDVWGALRKPVRNEFGSHQELCDYPLRDARSIDDLKRHDWPQPDWWDFSRLPEVIEKINPGGEYHLRYRVGAIFESAWSLCGIDKMLENLALNPELPCYLMDRVNEIHLENLRRVMEIAGEKIDMVYSYDDLASQRGLLMSAAMWKESVGRRQQELFALAKRYGKPVMYHCCGNVSPLVGPLIDIGVDVLNPIQPLALNMDFQTLKQAYGSKLTFHGGIDIQDLLPHGSPEQVAEEVERAKRILGQEGGYILAPAHHIQADTPVENILAIYR